MPVVISEIVTEVVLAPEAAAGGGTPGAGGGLSPEQLDAVVRRATERVVEILRREWDA